MKALLLAAGLGTRLAPFTDALPKCLVPVSGRPPLLRALDWLSSSGVEDVVINLHHLPETVTAAVDEGSAWGMQIRFSREDELLGTAGALDPLRDWVGDERVLIFYSDNIIRLDLTTLMRRHESTAAAMTVALFHRTDVRASGVARLDASDLITGFVEKPPEGGPGWVSAGLLYCEPSVLDHIPRGRASDFGRDVIPDLLKSGAVVAGHRLGADDGLWWIDTPSDLARVEAELAALEGAA